MLFSSPTPQKKDYMIRKLYHSNILSLKKFRIELKFDNNDL